MNWGLITGLSGLITGLIAVYLALRKQPHEIRNLDADTAQKYQDMLDKAILRIDQMEEEVAEYREGVDLLITQLKSAGLVPCWEPKPRERTRPRKEAR